MCNLNLSGYSKSDNAKHEVIMLVAKQYNKNSSWCINISRVLDLKITLKEER